MSHGVGSLVVVDSGEEAMLDLILAVNYTLGLFTNDVTAGLTPAQVDALTTAAFTPATFTGYAAKALTGGAWTTTPGNPSVGVYAAQAFAVTVTGAAQNVRGYYITRTSDGVLQAFEQFAGPVVMEFAGDTLNVTPRVTLDDSEGYEVEPGTITAFAGATAPVGWLLCDGSAVSRSTYADLFAVMSTAYGAGDGSTTFNLPDLRQRFPLGKAASGTGSSLGDTGGAIDHVHDHAGTGAAAAVRLSATTLAVDNVASAAWTDDRNATGLTTTATANAQTNGAALVGDTASENPPFQTVNFIVKA